MLLLLSHIDEVTYAFPCDTIVEVIPKVNLKDISHASPFLSGLLYYRGNLVPVIDFSLIVAEHPCEETLGTRILIFSNEENGEEKLIGVTTERATEIITKDIKNLSTSNVALKDHDFLGSVIEDNDKIIQLVDTQKLFETYLSTINKPVKT